MTTLASVFLSTSALAWEPCEHEPDFELEFEFEDDDDDDDDEFEIEAGAIWLAEIEDIDAEIVEVEGRLHRLELVLAAGLPVHRRWRETQEELAELHERRRLLVALVLLGER